MALHLVQFGVLPCSLVEVVVQIEISIGHTSCEAPHCVAKTHRWSHAGGKIHSCQIAILVYGRYGSMEFLEIYPVPVFNQQSPSS